MNKKLTEWMKEHTKETKRFKKELNTTLSTKTVKLSKIKIRDDFSKHMPKPDKIAAKYDYTKNQLRINRKYNAHRKLFQSTIIMDKRNNLLDGYTSYLIAKMLGIEKVEVMVSHNEFKSNWL